MDVKKCNYSFYSENELNSHVNKTHLALKECCEICGKEVPKMQLKKHILREHERSILCLICNKAFSDSSILRKHTEFVHKGIRNFHCDECKRSFFTQNNLNKHIKTVHKGIKEHKCNLCEISYTT